MNKPVIPERFKGAYSDLQEHFAGCRSDEVERDWPTSLCAKAIEQLGAAEAKVAEQAATIERLTGIIQAARKHKLLILHDAECFSIDGSKPCVCGREELRAILDAGDMHASSAITMMAINERLTKALCMLYDKYEDGPPCTEDGDEFGSPLGNCVQLTADEEDEILALIPASRDAALSKQEPK